jgi:hypothetical protein
MNEQKAKELRVIMADMQLEICEAKIAQCEASTQAFRLFSMEQLVVERAVLNTIIYRNSK